MVFNPVGNVSEFTSHSKEEEIMIHPINGKFLVLLIL